MAKLQKVARKIVHGLNKRISIDFSEVDIADETPVQIRLLVEVPDATVPPQPDAPPIFWSPDLNETSTFDRIKNENPSFKTQVPGRHTVVLVAFEHGIFQTYNLESFHVMA